MSIDLRAAFPTENKLLTKTGKAWRFLLIGAILASVMGVFAYVGGWFSPHALTPARFVDTLEQVDGVHPGHRRNHARGLGVSGWFDSNGKGVAISKAALFPTGRVPIVGRFSLGGGQPYAPDKPNEVRGLGIQFSLPNGELWRTAMINLPVFPVRTPEAFHERMVISRPDPNTGKPDPAKAEAFLAEHPETRKAMAVIGNHPASSGFGNSTFHSVNAFRFINSAGESTPVRWELTPALPYHPADANTIHENNNYLFDELTAQVKQQPLQWHLLVIVGKPGDPTNDATIPWPQEREKVDVGTITLDRVENDENSAARDINFDPLVLPVGMAASDDPLLSARSAIYSQSFTRRAGETREVPPGDQRKGQ